MRKIKYLLFLIVFTTITAFSQQKAIDLNWQTDFEKVKQDAQAENKLILMYFTGSDWSKPCKLLNKDFFYTKKFKEATQNDFILVRVNSPRRPDLISTAQLDKNLALRKLYNQKVFPSVVITNAKGKQIGSVESYNYLHDTSKHYKLIEDSLQKKEH